MEATVDTLVSQVTKLLLSKIDEQKFDPNFLQKFTDSLLGKLTYKAAGPIKQREPETTSKRTSSTGLVDDLKNAYKDLLNDTGYKNDYKKFLEYVLPESLSNEDKNVNAVQLPEIKSTETSKPEPLTAEVKSTESIKPTQPIAEGRTKLIQTPTEKQKVIFDGFSERGWAFLSERLPKILKNLPLFKPQPDKQQGGGIGLLGGGLALLLGGLTALVTGLMTDGPFKGILKILSKAGIEGGIKLLQAAAKVFINGLKEVIKAPLNLLDDAAKSIGKIFGKDVYKAVLKPLRGLSGIFSKMLGGLIKLITPLLKRIPLIGTVISWGFAYTRFKSGDVVGGIIDVLSGVASIFPGVGTAIGIGLDVLNAFLDVKAGGATEKASQGKTGLLKEWTLSLGKILYDGVKYIPIIGPFMQAVEDMQSGKWLDATYNLVRAIPGLGIVLDVINYFTEGQAEDTVKGGLNQAGNKIGEWLSWVRENIWKKITGFVTGVFDDVKDWWNNLSWDPTTWVGMAPEPPKQPNTQKQTDTTTTSTQPVPLAEGGIVTQPVNAIVGEAGPEAVMPLEKYFNPQDLTLNNTTLEQIAANTSDTNSSLKVLSDALFKLIVTLDKKTSSGNTTVINSIGRGSQQPASASVIANTNIDPIRRVRMQFA